MANNNNECAEYKKIEINDKKPLREKGWGANNGVNCNCLFVGSQETIATITIPAEASKSNAYKSAIAFITMNTISVQQKQQRKITKYQKRHK